MSSGAEAGITMIRCPSKAPVIASPLTLIRRSTFTEHSASIVGGLPRMNAPAMTLPVFPYFLYARLNNVSVSKISSLESVIHDTGIRVAGLVKTSNKLVNGEPSLS